MSTGTSQYDSLLGFSPTSVLGTHFATDDRCQSSLLPEVEIDLAAFWKEVDRRLPKK